MFVAQFNSWKESWKQKFLQSLTGLKDDTEGGVSVVPGVLRGVTASASRPFKGQRPSLCEPGAHLSLVLSVPRRRRRHWMTYPSSSQSLCSLEKCKQIPIFKYRPPIHQSGWIPRR